jgi:hypothetical protein
VLQQNLGWQLTLPNNLAGEHPVFVDNADNNVDTTEEVKDINVDSVNTIVDKTSDRLLSGADLAKRLGVNPGTLSRNRAKPNFTQWS